MRNHRSRRTLASVSFASALVAITLAVPSLVLAATIVVNTIPGAGWIQSPDNDGPAALVAGPAGGLGAGSLELTSVASSDFVGIVRPLVGNLSDLTGGGWMTFTSGDTGAPASEAASLRFAMFRAGGVSGFTTMTIELSENGGTTPGSWQTNAFDDQSMVWQTNTTGAFCLITGPCTLADFKTQYPQANLISLSVAIGTGVPPVTTWTDGVSVALGEVTDTWDFEPAAAAPTPTPTPTPPPAATPTPAPGATAAPAPTAPPTSTLDSDTSANGSGWLPAALALIALATFLGSTFMLRAPAARRASKRRR